MRRKIILFLTSLFTIIIGMILTFLFFFLMMVGVMRALLIELFNYYPYDLHQIKIPKTEIFPEQ